MTAPEGTFIYSDALSQVDTVKLNTGYLVRPNGQLGTCGFYPYPWTASHHKIKEVAQREFICSHHGKLAKHLRGE